MKADLLAEVEEYYSGKLAAHGPTPYGVDWNGEESQTLRFQQLCKVIRAEGAFSVNDLGCGYAALYDYIAPRHPDANYTGIDISPDMVRAAQAHCGETSRARFVVGSIPDRIADYGLASGIFNVRQEQPADKWLRYIEDTLAVLDRTSRLGFAFNCLTSYSDNDKMRDHLYYANPHQIFDFCMRRFSRNVALLHDYGLYEFTIIVRKST